jgi:hypothetical protein
LVPSLVVGRWFEVVAARRSARPRKPSDRGDDPADTAVTAEVLKTDFFGPYADVRLRATEGIVVTARCPGHLVPAIGTASD